MWYVINDMTLETVAGGYATEDEAKVEAVVWNLAEGYSNKYRVIFR
jgi:hypothetical protein